MCIGFIAHNQANGLPNAFAICLTQRWTATARWSVAREALEEDCRPHRDDRQSRPGQSLLRQPVQLVLRAVGGLGDAHLRDVIWDMFTKASVPWWRATAAVLIVASR